MILDNVADVIAQVNSNGPGYSKVIKLPSERGYFELTVNRNTLTMEYGNKKGIALLPLVNMNSEYRMVSGRSYTVSKTADGEIVIT